MPRSDAATSQSCLATWPTIFSGSRSSAPRRTCRSPASGEGRAEVAEFFRQVAAAEDFQQFEPREFVAQADKVVAIGHYRAVSKPSGKSFESDFVMVFTLRDGRVARFQEFTDSAGINAAFS
jgi:ketosteroid isomerase-like protein